MIRKIATIVPLHEKTHDNKELSRSHQINHFERELERRSSTHPSLDYLYREQMEFVRFHNGLVWQVSTVLVPFSLAGLALDFEDDYGMIDHLQLWFVAIGSIVTIVVWAILAEWHRWLWVNSLHLAKIIEAKWGYRGKPEIPGLWDTLGLYANPPAFLGVEAARHDWGRLTRLSIVLLVVLIWIFRLTISGDCHVPREAV